MSLSVEGVQTFLSLIAEERIQRELDGATPKEKPYVYNVTFELAIFSVIFLFSVYIFTFVSVFCFN